MIIRAYINATTDLNISCPFHIHSSIAMHNGYCSDHEYRLYHADASVLHFTLYEQCHGWERVWQSQIGTGMNDSVLTSTWVRA